MIQIELVVVVVVVVEIESSFCFSQITFFLHGNEREKNLATMLRRRVRFSDRKKIANFFSASNLRSPMAGSENLFFESMINVDNKWCEDSAMDQRLVRDKRSEDNDDKKISMKKNFSRGFFVNRRLGGESGCV